MPTILITWHSMKDERVCPICQRLDGFTWSFTTGQNDLNGVLEHPDLGLVWTIEAGSGAHGDRGNCRCWITYEILLEDTVQKIRELYDTLKEACGEEVAK
jgi:hypothetical protein